MTKPNKDQIEAYKEMARTSPDSMKAKIEANLKATCDKYAGHEDRLDDCIGYLTECAREILDNKSGEVDNETCFRICRDFFNDELWKEEEPVKAEEAKPENTEKKKPKKKTRKISDFEKEQLAKERERIEKLKEKHGLKAAEPVKEEPVKAEPVKAEPVKAEPVIEALVTNDGSMKPEPGQLDFFAAMGC